MVRLPRVNEGFGLAPPMLIVLDCGAILSSSHMVAAKGMYNLSVSTIVIGISAAYMGGGKVGYKRPKEKLHKGFVYLDDEVVTNSLSAIEAGRVDEVLSKMNQTSRGGFGGSVGFGWGPAKADVNAEKGSSNELEQTVRRTRTRFSIFESWYEVMKSRQGLGIIDSWEPDVLVDIEPGDTIEFRAVLEISGIETLVRLYKWYAGMAETKGNIFSQPKEQMPGIRQAKNIMTQMMGDENETTVTANPVNATGGPALAMPMNENWRIGSIGRMEGVYTVVAQVDRVLSPDEEWPAIRMIPDAPITSLELRTLKSALSNFESSAEAMGIEISERDAALVGPALILTPIAVFR